MNNTFYVIFYILNFLINKIEIEVDPQSGIKKFTPSVLLLRLNKFESNLLQIVKKIHQVDLFIRSYLSHKTLQDLSLLYLNLI